MHKIRQVNEVYEDVCCKTLHVKFINIYGQLFQSNYRDVITDGTHPNNKGIDILKYTISEGVKNDINIEYPPLPEKYVSHNVQITSGVTSRSEDKIKANSSEPNIQYQGTIPSSKSIQEVLQDHSHSLRTDIPQTNNLTHRGNNHYVLFQILPSECGLSTNATASSPPVHNAIQFEFILNTVQPKPISNTTPISNDVL